MTNVQQLEPTLIQKDAASLSKQYAIIIKNGIVHMVMVKVKVKVKVVPVLLLTDCHTMKAYWGTGGTAPRIL
jgi:hypothetical protein